MLTDEGDIVLDIFGGSNTTGFAAESLNRKWLTFEINREYVTSSALRFLDGHGTETMKRVLGELNNGNATCFIDEIVCDQTPLLACLAVPSGESQSVSFSGSVGKLRT
jgi:site-specific DNA-methyltransferase (cytosine-N4-specific)